MILKLLLLFGTLLIAHVAGKNVTCKGGKSNTRVKINKGDNFTFSTAGDEYAAGLNCKAEYHLGTCKNVALSCSNFDTVSVSKKCLSGDRLIIKARRNNVKRFCRNQAPKLDLTSEGSPSEFMIKFLSGFIPKHSFDKQTGIKCTVRCKDDESENNSTLTAGNPSITNERGIYGDYWSSSYGSGCCNPFCGWVFNRMSSTRRYVRQRCDPDKRRCLHKRYRGCYWDFPHCLNRRTGWFC